MNKILNLAAMLVLTALPALAEHVTWSYKIVGDNTPSPSVVITANVDPGFHLYAPNTPDGGGQPLEFHFETKGCALSGTPA